jgi:hypothetical protein
MTITSPEEPEARKTLPEAGSDQEDSGQAADLTEVGVLPALAAEEDILARFEADLAGAGVVGEVRMAKLTYLCLTSRLLPWEMPTERPVSLIAKGTTSTGKSFTQRAVLRFFPPAAFFDLGSMSKKYLLYSEESLSHRFVVIPEWSAIAGEEEIVTSVRILLSEGRLIHGTVEGEGKKEPRRIEKEGPTGLLMTTTAVTVDRELETRCMSVHTDDSPEQTRRIFKAMAELEDGGTAPVDYAAWHELQSWLTRQGESRAVIPFLTGLSELMPIATTRLRRDFPALLSLIRAHAILHRATRDTDERGRIVATIADYAAVYALVADLVAEAADAAVTPAVRETVEAVEELLGTNSDGQVTVRQIEQKLGVGHSAAYDRVNNALLKGYLVNVAVKGKLIKLGTPLPVHGNFLPTPNVLTDRVREMSNEAPDRLRGSIVPLGTQASGLPAVPVEVDEPAATNSNGNVGDTQLSLSGFSHEAVLRRKNECGE